MKVVLAILLVLFVAQTSAEGTKTATPALVVGQMVTGSIDPQVSNEQIYPIQVEAIKKKYLFIRLRTSVANQAAIGFYSNTTGELLYSCMNDTNDACYVPGSMLTENHEYAILVMCNTPLNFQLITFWGDLEHIKPDEEIRFIFDNDQSQLLHLDLDESVGSFDQIRLILRPQTVRAEGDSLKMFAKIGLSKEPTQENHDYKSIHIWNDAQAIFLSSAQLKNEKGVSIFIVGNAKTVYIMSAEVIKKDHHDIKVNENLYEYVNPKEQTLYHMSFLDSNGTASAEVYVVRFSVFTGEVEVGFYTDKEMKNVFREISYQYMSDIQFHIKKQELTNANKDLYMLVRGRDAASTFQLNFQGRRKSQSFEIYENVYEFLPLTSSPRSLHFYSHLWAESQSQYFQQKTHRFDISFIRVQGDSNIEFFKCKPTESEEVCQQRQNPDFAASTIKFNYSSKTSVGSKVIYTLEITNEDYRELFTNVEKRALILVHLSSVSEKGSFVALELHNSNKIRFLRQGRAFEDKVRRDQVRTYKYQNINPNVGFIKIHINEISGLTQIQAFRSENSKEQPISMSPDEPNTIIINQKLTDPVLIKIRGVVTSIFTITVITTHNEHPLSSSLTLNEEVEYQLKLLPYSYVNLELHPIEQKVMFDYSSVGGSIMLCEVNNNDQCKEGSKIIGNKQRIQVDAKDVREVKIRLSNFGTLPNKNYEKGLAPAQLVRPVKVKVIYHSMSEKHCEERKINRVYSEGVELGSCFTFHLPLVGDVEIMSSRENSTENLVRYVLCQHWVVPEVVDNRYKFSEKFIGEICKDFVDDINLALVVTAKPESKHQEGEIKMDYSVQYTNDIITLSDGVAYYLRTKSLESSIRTFFYEILDELSSFQIILLNKRGKQYFFAKIVSAAERYTNAITESEATISSQKSNFYSNPSIQITQSEIKKAKCARNCMVIISVFSREKPGTEIEFGIEINEHQTMLTEGVIKTDFLAKGSVHYYGYETKHHPTDLLLKVSDNNRKCTTSYLSNHPYPSPSNNIVTENEPILTYKNADKGKYYFAVEAREDCPYSVVITEGSSKLQKLEFEQSFDIKLAEGEQVWFYVNHLSSSSFKIYSLLKHGQLEISANSTQISHEILQAIELGHVQPDKFDFKNVEFSSLFINSDAKGFCSECSYLINVKARKITEGNIFLALESSKISLTADKVLFDQLKTVNSSSYIIFYKVSSGQLTLNVFSGTVNVQMTYDDQKFEKTFEKKKQAHVEPYYFAMKQGFYIPIHIKVIAVSAPAIYSLSLRPELSKSTRLVKLSPGVTSLVKIDKEEECVTGTLRSKEEEIYMAVDLGDNVNLQNLDLNITLGGKEISYLTENFGKVMVIKFDIKQVFFPDALDFKICIPSKPKFEGVTLYVSQNEKMNLISPDSMVFVRGESTYAIYQTGSLIVDMFQCSGKGQLAESSKAKDLEKKTLKNLDIIGINGQNHAIRLEAEEVIFLKAKVPFGQLLWMPLSEQNERGIGYYKYAIGKLSYATSFNEIKFVIGGVFKSKETKTTVQSVKYVLHISNSRESLQGAVECQMGHQNVIQVNVESAEVGDGSAPQIITKVEKKIISAAFPNDETLYFNVVADLTLVAPNEEKDHEHYRFVYSEQLVLAELLRQNQIESKVNFDIYIPIIVVTCIGAISVIYAIVRWLIPALARLKGSIIIDENNEDNKEYEMQVPASSERNQMSAATSQRMG